MAGPFKTTLIFDSETGSGWTETWYNLGAGNLEMAGTHADILCTVRVGLIGKGNTIPSWKVLDVTQPRFSLSRDGMLGPFVPNKFPTDRPAGSQLGTCTCAPFPGRRQFWMRGVPDDWITFDPDTSMYVLNPAFIAAFTPFRDHIQNGRWGLRLVKSYKNSNLKGEVGVVQEDLATGFAKLTLRAGNTLPEKVNIVVGGFKKPLQSLNGTYLWPNGYTRTGADIVLRGKFISPIQGAGYVAGGTVRQQQFDYQPITRCAYDRPGGRKVGKFIGVPAGRR